MSQGRPKDSASRVMAVCLHEMLFISGLLSDSIHSATGHLKKPVLNITTSSVGDGNIEIQFTFKESTKNFHAYSKTPCHVSVSIFLQLSMTSMKTASRDAEAEITGGFENLRCRCHSSLRASWLRVLVSRTTCSGRVNPSYLSQEEPYPRRMIHRHCGTTPKRSD